MARIPPPKTVSVEKGPTSDAISSPLLSRPAIIEDTRTHARGFSMIFCFARVALPVDLSLFLSLFLVRALALPLAPSANSTLLSLSRAFRTRGMNVTHTRARGSPSRHIAL